MTSRSMGGHAAIALGIVLWAPMAAHARPQPTASPDLQTATDAFRIPIFSAPVAAPKGGKVAWVVEDAGSRNIWVADIAAANNGPSRAITSYAGDDGNEVGQLAWDPAGRVLAFVRGGMIEGGAATNLLSSGVAVPAREVWTVGSDGQGLRKIGTGHAPAFSPDGRSIAFLADHLTIAPLDGGAAVTVDDIGDVDRFDWSPDGRKIAVVSSRSGHSIVGVYDLRARSITWLAPGFDDDGTPVWSPDSRRVAFVRVPAHRLKSYGSRAAGPPWSLWLADAETGQGRSIFVANAGAGSVFRSIDGNRTDLIWSAGDRIVFPWEKTGWLNLYAVSINGGAPVPLAGGRFEVFSTTPTPDARSVIYACNCEGLDRRDLHRVSASGGDDRALTGGPLFADRPAVGSDGSLIFLSGGSRQPFLPVVQRERVTTALATIATQPFGRYVDPRVVRFKASDGVEVSAQLFEPPAGSARGPALLYFHGGPSRQMLAGFNPSRYYSMAYAMNQYLASQGYTILSVNYRGGIGYGLEFREAAGFGPGGASEVRDIRAAAEFLHRQPGVDPARVGIYGPSYGGYMTALGLARVPDLLFAGVDYAGVHDWRTFEPSLSKPDAPVAARDLAWASSPLSDVSKWTAPVLVAQADDDRDVPFDQGIALVERLRERPVVIEQLVIPNEMHDFRLFRSWGIWAAATDDFFRRQLPAKATQR